MASQELLEKLKIPIYQSLTNFPCVQKKEALIPYALAMQKLILPVEKRGEKILIAMSQPEDLQALEEVRHLLQAPLEVVYCPKETLLSAIEQCYQQNEEEKAEVFSQRESLFQDTPAFSEEYDLLADVHQNPVIRMVNTLFIEAISEGASDIHFEPMEEGLQVRYRIDGVLLTRHAPAQEYQVPIITRIKVMAKLDIAEHRLPQDGRIKLRHGGREIDFRVSTLPVIYGERLVLRILDRGNVLLGLDRLGMSSDILKRLRKLMQAPEGIFLVTGPTGSGKTTTLYSALSEFQSEEMHIITIEDPVEYKLPGISQMNVNRQISLDFSKGLRHILRQDPDVMMIGEIRDKETADIAIQSSLTGHFVLSTLHTNDAPSALTRLVDMGIEPYLLASSITGVLAQRLVRAICLECKESYLPSKEELSEMKLRKEAFFYRGKGCEKCFQTGYKGRYGLYELMPMSSKIKAKILQSQDAEQIRKVAVAENMQTLFERGKELVLEGITTCSEVLRVTQRIGE